MSDLSHVGMTRCFYCLEHSEILLDTRLRPTLPQDCGVISMRPCHKCEALMQQGVIIIGIKGASMPQVEKDHQEWKNEYAVATEREREHMRPFIPNPERSGHWMVVSDEFIKRVFNPPELVARVLKGRWTFMDDEAIKQLGLDKVEPKFKTVEEATKEEHAATTA